MIPDLNLSLAQYYARTKHEGQSYGVLPYTHHLADVEKWLRFFGVQNETLLYGAWLHDILEDTDTKYRDLFEAFGKSVADLVEAVTGRGANRRECNADAYEKIREHGELAVILKLADRIANCTHSGASIGMYRKEWEGFRRALYDRNHVLAQPMWDYLEGLMTDGG